eukprot:5657102-Amphidinium_carterae.2
MVYSNKWLVMHAQAAVRFGWDFRDRTQDHVIVRVATPIVCCKQKQQQQQQQLFWIVWMLFQVGELEQRYRLLALNPFDSTRCRCRMRAPNLPELSLPRMTIDFSIVVN